MFKQYRILSVMVLLIIATSAIGADEAGKPELPWAKSARENLPPGKPDADYKPVIVPNGATLESKIVDGVKVYHLIAEQLRQKFAPGLVVDCWGYNGRTPGPVIEAVEGDRVRIYVTNKLPEATSVHWHGILLPSGMDGVAGLNQVAIQPGETFRYEFYFPKPGTFMYHPHYDEMTQMGLGLIGMIVVHPRNPEKKKPDRDFALMVHEWFIEPGTTRPDPNKMSDFNILTINGKAFPGTDPLVAKIGDLVRIRIGNLSAMDHHPIHLHGHSFKVVETDGGQIPESAQWPETTVIVPVGSTRAVEFIANNPGDWLMHCHMTHHIMNQMGHGIPNLVGVDMGEGELDQKIRGILPEYMTMGNNGMGGMAEMGMRVPRNSIPMVGKEEVPFGYIDMGGMTTIFKARENLTTYDDPGWYEAPEETIAKPAMPEEMEKDGIVIEKKSE